MVEVLSKSLGLKKSQFELIAGPTSHQKRFFCAGSSSMSWPGALAGNGNRLVLLRKIRGKWGLAPWRKSA